MYRFLHIPELQMLCVDWPVHTTHSPEPKCHSSGCMYTSVKDTLDARKQ